MKRLENVNVKKKTRKKKGGVVKAHTQKERKYQEEKKMSSSYKVYKETKLTRVKNREKKMWVQRKKIRRDVTNL